MRRKLRLIEALPGVGVVIGVDAFPQEKIELSISNLRHLISQELEVMFP